MTDVKHNSLKAWLFACRPKTLAAGSVPVVVASALAARHGQFKPLAAFLCLMFALLSQIASNFGNDYFDYARGGDTDERLGPPRACASGWIDPFLMLFGALCAAALGCAFGLGLIFFGGWPMIFVGAACVIALFAYSAGPFPLSRYGMGDLFVLIFFGFVAVVFSYYVQSRAFHYLAFVCGGSVGLAAVNILIVNNYRDAGNDRACGKMTTIVIFGKRAGRIWYLANGFLSCALCLFFLREGMTVAALLPFAYLVPHILTWRKISAREGRDLNPLLGETSRNLLILGLLLSAGILL